MADRSNTANAYVCECGNHAWKPITKGYVVLVDPEDSSLIEGGIHAHLSKTGRNVYAADWERRYIHTRIVRAPRGKFVDHRDGNGLDNRRENLRVATYSQNQHNRKKTPGLSSRFKGVSYCKRRDRWEVRATVNRQHFRAGYFEDEIEAAKAYDRLARELHGEFARTNESLGLLAG